MEAQRRIEKICKYNPHLLELQEIKDIARAWQRDIDKLSPPKDTDFGQWVKLWVSKWPSPKETNLSYSVSGNLKTCTKKMKAFVKSFHVNLDVSKEDYGDAQIMAVIDKATDSYLAQQRMARWERTMKNSNFIDHQEKGSLLETFCWREIHGARKPLPKTTRF